MNSVLLFLMILFSPHATVLIDVPKYEPPMVNIGVFHISRYYSVMPNQRRYYMKRTYEEDLAMNCGGDCLHTASGHFLTRGQEWTIMACPRNFSMGAELYIEGLGNVRCEDRGGAIKGKRLDLWSGIGDEGLDNIWKHPEKAGTKTVYLLSGTYES